MQNLHLFLLLMASKKGRTSVAPLALLICSGKGAPRGVGDSGSIRATCDLDPLFSDEVGD